MGKGWDLGQAGASVGKKNGLEAHYVEARGAMGKQAGGQHSGLGVGHSGLV